MKSKKPMGVMRVNVEERALIETIRLYQIPIDVLLENGIDAMSVVGFPSDKEVISVFNWNLRKGEMKNEK